MENRNTLLIPTSIADDLPAMVRNELSRMSAQHQEEFIEEYKRKRKSLGVAYLFLLIMVWLHYGYLGKWGLQLLFWFTVGGFFFWWFADIFRLPGLIRSYNMDVATDVMRNLKAITRE